MASAQALTRVGELSDIAYTRVLRAFTKQDHDWVRRPPPQPPTPPSASPSSKSRMLQMALSVCLTSAVRPSGTMPAIGCGAFPPIR